MAYNQQISGKQQQQKQTVKPKHKNINVKH